MKTILGIDKVILKLERMTIFTLLFIMCTSLIFDVLLREIFSYSLVWAQKLSVYLMIWIGLIGASVVMKKNEHLAPTIGEKLTKKYLGKLYIILKYSILTSFCFYLCYYSFLYVHESYEFADKSLVFSIPQWCFQLIFIYVFFMVGFRSLIHFLLDFSESKKPEVKE
ncbi:TRAP transporter small permease subunit [Bacteriovoracaceae bacterium]|nr:TRAP transporter small permease subunit [Bacteriovoracaceae bacterium]